MQKIWFRVMTTGMTLALMAMIFFFSTESAEKSDSTSGIISGRVADIIQPRWREMEEEARLLFYNEVQFAVRKTAHFSEFFLLGASMLLCLESWISGEKRNRLYSWMGGTIWALLDEIHQGTVAGRSSEITDIFLDSFGTASGVVITYLIMRAVVGRAGFRHIQKKG